MHTAMLLGAAQLRCLPRGALILDLASRPGGTDFAAAREFVDSRKQQRLRATALLYLSQHESELQPRFDVIEIYAPAGTQTRRPQITHMEDAF